MDLDFSMNTSESFLDDFATTRITWERQQSRLAATLSSANSWRDHAFQATPSLEMYGDALHRASLAPAAWPAHHSPSASAPLSIPSSVSNLRAEDESQDAKGNDIISITSVVSASDLLQAFEALLLVQRGYGPIGGDILSIVLARHETFRIAE